MHELHNGCPLAPEKLKISQNMLPKYCYTITNKYGMKIGGVNKLGNKGNYRNLQLYLSLGIKSAKVYRILKIKQSDWLKKYNHFNKDKRKC